jgi:hypothetical protein
MNNKTLHINNPSEKLLSFVRSLQLDKENNKKELLSNKELYFKK